MVTVVSPSVRGSSRPRSAWGSCLWYEMSVRVTPRWEQYGWIALSTAEGDAAVRLSG